MIKKYKYLLLLLFGLFFFIPKDTYAISISSGVAYPYVALGNQNVFPEYDSGYTHSHSHSINLKNSQDWYSLQGSQAEGGYYTVIKKFRIEITSNESLQSGKEYKLVLATDYDAYITFSDFYGWRWSVDRNLTYCKVGNTDMASCSISWSPINGTTHNGSNIVIRFTPNSSGSSFTIDIGTISGSQKFVAWNRYGGSQNFNMNFTSLDLEGSGGSGGIDTGEIIANQNANQQQTNERLDSIGDDLTDINDTLSDDSSVSSGELQDFFDDIPLITSGPISDLMLLPTFILNAIINRSSTTCPAGSYFSIDLPYVDGGFEFHCWTLSDYVDSYTVNTITWILYVVMFYNIAMLVISCWETWTNLSTDFASMYTPKHGESEYKPKHGGGN